MKDLGLIPEGYKILVVASVQEEDCDGLCWQYIYNEDKVVPEFVVSTEPTDGGVYRGHRGRMEIRVDVKGISCHGSAPERGDNAIYKMADFIEDVRVRGDAGQATIVGDGSCCDGVVRDVRGGRAGEDEAGHDKHGNDGDRDEGDFRGSFHDPWWSLFGC